ncbi:DUF3080 family protein [uncultured Paraglaciecola sp.]|uniref:DUF3080 family protein n=1 Tax=uncultured Paraglaciecola sp. TaxID=1765024 RepID=UPI0030D7EB80|tara:strand:- start:2487 stop:3548 length:1062 start_codon:yes stop_codon:yes gene_type:complete
MNRLALANLRSVHLCLILQLTLTLFGCGKNNLEKTFDDYQQRMANVLDSPFVDKPFSNPQAHSLTLPSTTLRYPSIRELTTTIEVPSIDVKQFFALDKCDVNVLIAQRNTPLGRTQLPSVRYIYEYKMLASLARCSKLMPQQRENLNRWISQKQTVLPLVWANLLQTSKETINAFSNNSSFISFVSATDIQQTQNALTYLLHLKTAPQATISAKELERNLEQLAKIHLPAKTWRTQALMAKELTSTTTWLKQQPLFEQCPDGQASQQIIYLKNVFTLFFIEKIQPVGSDLNRVHYTLSPLYQTLGEQTELHESFRRLFNEQNTTSFSTYQHAMKEHVLFWQQLFKHCSISPHT